MVGASGPGGDRVRRPAKTQNFWRLTMTKLFRRPVLATAIICLGAATVFGDSDQNTFKTSLSGFKEVGNTGPVNSPGSGQFQVTLTSSAMTYTLTYSALSTS